jgi:hypothetical protein
MGFADGIQDRRRTWPPQATTRVQALPQVDTTDIPLAKNQASQRYEIRVMAQMINYVVSWQHAYTIAPFIRTEFPHLSSLIKIRTYEELLPRNVVAPGLHIFTDFDRLSAKEVGRASQIADFVRNGLGDQAVVNHPREVLGRFELIEAMKAQGNQFSAFRADEIKTGISPRFPVFLRRDKSHQGSISGLLHDWDQLLTTIDLAAHDIPISDIRVVEFCDTRDAETGLFTKYSAHHIGGKIIPDHVIFSKKWMLRRSDIVTPDLVEKELDYVLNNPHEHEIKKIFEIANIGYGRIDYSFSATDGSMQVWEININPDLSRPAQEERMKSFRIVSSNIIAAFEAMSSSFAT